MCGCMCVRACACVCVCVIEAGNGDMSVNKYFNIHITCAVVAQSVCKHV